jgi:L-alanine-DL-glutamate epimerase-like enolase superfamily enzyme
MRTSRRDFLLKAVKTTGFMAAAPYISFGQSLFTDEKPSMLNLHKAITTPVKIVAVDIIKTQGELFVRTTSADGITGATMCNQRMEYLIPILKGLVVPAFVGKDARDLEEIIDLVYRDGRNYKYAGMPFSNCVGHVELSILDMLGKIANKPAGLFYGKVVRTEIPMYLSSLTRENTAEEEVDWLAKRLSETGALAVKLKVGGRMTSEESVPGRTKAIIPLARKKLGDNITIYADANGSYTTKEGIEVGKMLEDHGVKIFEEPCAWEDNTANKQVADALKKITLAGGEQDTSLHRFKYIIDNKVYDLVQPDLYYNGGFIRCMQVAQMAARAGRGIAPHSPKADPLEAAMLQLASVVPNLEGFQEYPSNAGRQLAWYSPHFEIKNGKLPILMGPGLGVTYDEDIWKKAEKV